MSRWASSWARVRRRRANVNCLFTTMTGNGGAPPGRSTRQVNPDIVVTIGQQSRLSLAFVTSAPCRLDAPATITLYASTLADVAVFAANEIAVDAAEARSGARLVLVDAAELAW